MITNSWHKLLNGLHNTNVTAKSRQAERLIIQIGRVPADVRRRALEEFLRCSQRVHTIAFLQWRHMFPTSRTMTDQLKELIEERMVFMYGYLKDYYPTNLPSDDYGTDAAFYKAFRPAIREAQSYNIWSFEQIGLFDPFPQELMDSKYEVPRTADNLVYAAHKYQEDDSPNTLYFPSKLLLFKIMKACIDVEEEKDLWF